MRHSLVHGKENMTGSNVCTCGKAPSFDTEGFNFPSEAGLLFLLLYWTILDSYSHQILELQLALQLINCREAGTV